MPWSTERYREPGHFPAEIFRDSIKCSSLEIMEEQVYSVFT